MGFTAHNKRYTQIALIGQFGLHKTPVGCALSAGTPFVGFCSAHFFVPVKMLRIFPHRAQKNVVYLERYAQVFQNKKIEKPRKNM